MELLREAAACYKAPRRLASLCFPVFSDFEGFNQNYPIFEGSGPTKAITGDTRDRNRCPAGGSIVL